MFTIEITRDKALWNSEVVKFPWINVTASYQWLNFKTMLGNKTETFFIRKNKDIVGLIPIEYVQAKRGKYLISEAGPIIDWENSDLVQFALSWLKTKIKNEHLWFLRISPYIDNVTAEKVLPAENFSINKYGTQARSTLYIDLKQPTDQILRQMRKNTRYLIRQADKKYNISVSKNPDMSGFEVFADIYTDTVSRKRWKALSIDYIKQQYQYFSKERLSQIYTAYYKQKPIASAMFTAFGDEVIYHHSGSINKFRNIPAMYKVLWEVINDYKQQGYSRLNLFGVLPKNEMSPKKSKYGISVFKYGFGGEYKHFIYSADYINNPLAYLTKTLENFELRKAQ